MICIYTGLCALKLTGQAECFILLNFFHSQYHAVRTHHTIVRTRVVSTLPI